ncbi:kinase domain-containing protein [Favolaschia claudopus]|uniref:Kinase domain-containing protein n=1 Tax=Favolaschia claudopus TaxID=2862362 RepID=A0AAW0A7W9_9AGAR
MSRLVDLGLFYPKAKNLFWTTIFNSDQNLWLWEDEDEYELKHQFTRASKDRRMQIKTQTKAEKLQECSKRVNGTERLTHLESTARIRFLMWLFIVEMHSINDADVGLQETIVDWMQFFDHYPTRTVLHGPRCRCDPGAIKDWVNVFLQVYAVADLRLMPWGSSCNCLDAELASRPIDFKTNSVGVPLVLGRWLFQTFIPTWPSILWVLFRTLRLEEPNPVLAFMSLLREEQHRDLFAWDDTDLTVLQVSGVHERFKIGPLRVRLDWHRYVSEIDSQTWNMIRSLTRVDDCLSACHDPTLRICAFILMLCMSLNIPRPLAQALDIDTTSEYWLKLVDIGSPVYAKEPQLLSQRIHSEQFWSSSHLETVLKVEACDRCFDILHASRYTTLERVQLIFFILDNHETLQPLFAFYPAIGCILPRSFTTFNHVQLISFILKNNHEARFELYPFISSCRERWTSSRYVGGKNSATILSFRSDFKELVKILKPEMHQHHVVATHMWMVKLSTHAVECLIYLTARLVSSLQTRDGYDAFLEHRGTEAQEMLDLLQDLLDLESFSIIRPMLFKAMWRLSRASNLYPRCFTLTGLHKVGTQVAGGGYGDIWKGLVREQSVCVKMLRIFQESDIAIAVKEFGAEALIWRQLCHPNVLPFFGLYYIEQRLCLISPWMENGHIMEFLRANSPDTQKRFSMILDVASGLEYLHNQNAIHGDLKGINILVTPSERACIADFGLSIIVNVMTLRLTTSTTANHRGTTRYNAPELFEQGAKTFASDIYAFGCVAYEIMTGQLAFRELINDVQIILGVLKGKRPERLPCCTGTPALDKFWELLEMCWDGEKEKRPSACGIAKQLIQPPIGAAMTPMESADWDDQFTARFRRSINMEPLLPTVNQLEGMMFGEGKTRLLLFLPHLITPKK